MLSRDEVNCLEHRHVLFHYFFKFDENVAAKGFSPKM